MRIQDLPFRLLTALVERPGELVTRAELVQRLWGGETFIDFDAGLNPAVAKLREALGDSADTPRLLETVPKRGYRLLAAVTPTGSAEAGVVSSAAPVPVSVRFSRQGDAVCDRRRADARAGGR